MADNAVERPLDAAIERLGFAFVPREKAVPLLAGSDGLDDWAEFAASWNALEPDRYLAVTGRQRRRRHAVFLVSDDGQLVRAPDQPHYQTLADNPLQGGLERWFAPVLPAVAASRSLHALIAFGLELFGRLARRDGGWRIEAHQFRIEARPDAVGEPTPEGVHRDGVDYVLVALVRRRNIASGTTTIHAPDGRLLGSFTLTEALDLALVDDHRVLHGVTPVTPLDAQAPAYRDVLVLTYRAQPTPG